jgi:hypothetical protein
MESKNLRGSEFFTEYSNKQKGTFSQIATITDWKIVSPLEFKLRELKDEALSKEQDLKM